MVTRDLKVKDICTIIETCATAGVSTFDFHGLKLEFSSTTGGEAWGPEPSRSLAAIPPLRLSSEDKLVLRELEDTQTMMDDPVQWEQNIIDSYLGGGEEVHGEDEHSEVE